MLLVTKIRLIAMILRNLVELPFLRLARGDRYCPFCRRGFFSWLIWGYPSPRNEELHVIGAFRRRHLCPGCWSPDRYRLVAFWLEKIFGAGRWQPLSVLHVAPEPQLSRWFRQRSEIDYLAGDKRAADSPYSKRLPDWVSDVDVTNLASFERRFDLIVCNHVLEHILDDRLALRELFRALKPGGRAILQVPYTTRLEASVEDASVAGTSDANAREGLFGQFDHVRIYDLRPRRLPLAAARGWILRRAATAVRLHRRREDAGVGLRRRRPLCVREAGHRVRALTPINANEGEHGCRSRRGSWPGWRSSRTTPGSSASG
jgi:SAM-dependent methyltransferase